MFVAHGWNNLLLKDNESFLMKAMNTIAIIILSLGKFKHIFFVYDDQLQIPSLKPVIIVKNGASMTLLTNKPLANL